MSTVKTLLKVLAKSTHHPLTRQFQTLAEILKEANDILLDHEQTGMFVTILLGGIDFKSMKLTFANAGHNPPILLHQDGRIEELPKSGLPVGAFADFSSEDQQIQLNKGDRFIVYSDGLTEAMSTADEAFGLERLFTSVRRHAPKKIDEFAEAIVNDVVEFQKGRPRFDDITILVVQAN